MKVGVIVHSHTGNTLSVAEKMKEALSASGHEVTLEQVKAVNENPNDIKNIQLELNPDIADYEVLIFGAPVWAFSLSAVMNTYLKQLPSMNGKKVSGFVTQSFPFPWMGGNRSIKQIFKICGEKGASILKSGIVGWSKKNREELITKLVKDLSTL